MALEALQGGQNLSPDRDRAQPFVEIRSLTRRFGEVVAVDDLSLTIRRGEFFALLGPSGCGKTTLLRMIAGFETPGAGAILIDGVDVTHSPAHLRPTNMMFQSYALFPHMSVWQNIAYGPKQAGMAKPALKARVEEMLALGRLEALAHRKPDQLSGGQKQRVALVRALARQPKVLLLDEPLGALDRKLREETQFELMALQAALGSTFIVVTHDQDEAMILAHRIAVMERGRIAQVGTPQEIYEKPATRYVADFIGDVNLLEGRVSAVDDSRAYLACEGLPPIAVAPGALRIGENAALALRPEKIALSRERPEGADNALPARIVERAYLGDLTLFVVETDTGRRLKASHANHARGEALAARGETMWLSWNADAGALLPS